MKRGLLITGLCLSFATPALASQWALTGDGGGLFYLRGAYQDLEDEITKKEEDDDGDDKEPGNQDPNEPTGFAGKLTGMTLVKRDGYEGYSYFWSQYERNKNCSFDLAGTGFDRYFDSTNFYASAGGQLFIPGGYCAATNPILLPIPYGGVGYRSFGDLIFWSVESKVNAVALGEVYVKAGVTW